MNINELQNLLMLVQNIIKEAAIYVQKELIATREVENYIDRDVKVVADRKIESFIIDFLLKETEYNILSEESGLNNRKNSSDYIWIIDPLDGSLNFSRSIPLFCISIALWKKETPLFGVIYDFNHNEMFSGIVGEGARMNSSEIHVSDVKLKKDAVLCTGFPVMTDFSDKPLLNFVSDIQSFKKIRLFGSAALSLAYVACGRADYYKEDEIAVWDVAAGIALVLAAGGMVKYDKGKKENRLIVKASNRFLL